MSYVESKNIDLIEVESRMLVTRGQKWGGRLGKWPSMGTKLQLDRNKKLCGTIAQYGDYR